MTNDNTRKELIIHTGHELLVCGGDSFIVQPNGVCDISHDLSL